MRARATVGLVGAVVLIAGCQARKEKPGERSDQALAVGTRALIAAQASDGAWRSKTYGALKDGPSLTPTVLKAVVFGPTVAGSETARRVGADFLARLVRPDGAIDAGPFGLTYPVYTAATSAIVLGRAGNPAASAAWLRELRGRQLTEARGWGPTDLAYGGWGHSAALPVRIDESGTTGDADLSSTLFAVGALRIAGAAADDPAVRKALSFVERCQNVAESGRAGPAFDDGGFFLTPTDPARNKAGAAGTDRDGQARYQSYGSATADGLRALLRCGLSPEHARVQAALRWLEQRFSATRHPGGFEPGHEVERDSTYYYYCWSAAHAFRTLETRGVRARGQAAGWSEALARELIQRQRADGTWANPYSASKEDDPLIATPLALGALGNCRLGAAP